MQVVWILVKMSVFCKKSLFFPVPYCVVLCVFPILYVPQGVVFESDQKIQPVAFAAGWIFCLERADLNVGFKGMHIHHNISVPGLYHSCIRGRQRRRASCQCGIAISNVFTILVLSKTL